METDGERCDYLLFGLLVRSHRPIPGLIRGDFADRLPDLEVYLGISPPRKSDDLCEPGEVFFASPYKTEFGEPVFCLWRDADGGLLRLRYSDGMQFWLARDQKRLWASWPETSSLEDAATYLLGPVLALLLRLRGVTCLHASSVAFGNRAVAFTGPAGAGKSTTAAALGRRGHSVLSDDIVALTETSGTLEVMPAYPHLCLWPESASILYGSSDVLPRFSANWDKCRLADGDGGVRFEAFAQQLGAVYILTPRSADRAPAVEAVSASAGMMSLIPNTCANYALSPHMRAQEFGVLSRLVISVPIRRLRPHRDPRCLDELCDLIYQDFQSLSSSNARHNQPMALGHP
jgi:hypothetical protein